MATAASVEVNDVVFCQGHLAEVCNDCDVDFREENDSFYGLDSNNRDAIKCPACYQNKDGVYECKIHGVATCTQCFGWKKQITHLRKVAERR